MSLNVSEALLEQKIEFMQIELDDLKKKEENLKKTNECLMQALGSTDSLLTVTNKQTASMQDLKRTNEAQARELSELKTTYKDKISSLEKEKQELLMKVNDLEYSLKQQRIAMETEKLEIISQLQKIESDKMSVEQALKSYENDRNFQKDFFKYQQELKINDLTKQLDLSKEESRNEVMKTRQESDKALMDLKLMYERELEKLKSQLRGTSDKLRAEKSKIDLIRSDNNPKLMEIRIEELESELEFYKNKGSKDSLFLTSQEDEKKRNFKIESLALENEKIRVQLERSQLEVDQLAIELERTRRDKEETEVNLKNEIKFLIGKLLKAKSKLLAEGEFTETVRKDQILNGLRYKSFNRSRTSLRSSND